MSKNIIPKIAAVHDISGVGRCALSVILPVLSAMDMQACPVPTAVLSSHTGGYDGYTFVDLTDTMEQYFKHWQEEGVEIDCLYSGFLGSAKQIDILSSVIDKFSLKDKLVVVDPVFADDGEIYKTFDYSIISKMHQLIKKAHIITPNITEAELLINGEVLEDYTSAQIKERLKKLCGLGPNICVITSVPMGNSICSVAYDNSDKRFWRVKCDYVPAKYPGTGDIFTSVMCGALLQGDSLPVSMERAVSFVGSSIRATFGYKTEIREGVAFEKVLHTLSRLPADLKYELL